MQWMLMLLSLLHSQQREQVIEVDLIELNHCYTDRLCYTQVIAYEWSPDYRRHHVRAWRLIQDEMCDIQMRDGAYFIPWQLGGGKSAMVTSKSFIETTTPASRDPERLNRKLLSEDLRRPLR
jgi:hypothetical protein